MQCSRNVFSISSFIVNVTDCCRFHGRVGSHVPFATLGAHTYKRLGTAALRERHSLVPCIGWQTQLNLCSTLCAGSYLNTSLPEPFIVPAITHSLLQIAWFRPVISVCLEFFIPGLLTELRRKLRILHFEILQLNWHARALIQLGSKTEQEWLDHEMTVANFTRIKSVSEKRGWGDDFRKATT
jgi:hypothetical protein